METIKINDLEDANSISETDYLIIEKKDGTRKISAAYLKGEQGPPGKDGSFDPNQEFEDLTTTSKTIVNAINEVNMQISNKTNDFSYKVPKGEYFVLGDNRGNSMDSRVFGSFSKRKILGKTKLTIFPFSRFGNKE